MATSPEGAERRVLLDQFDLACRFARAYVVGHVDLATALWQPSSHVCTVVDAGGDWVADLPDEDAPVLPDVTIAWLLWHVEWWWTDSLGRLRGRPPLALDEHTWSGGTDLLDQLMSNWRVVLGEERLDREVSWPADSPGPLSAMAAWLNVELVKNLAEINQLQRLRSNRMGGGAASPGA